MSAAQKKKKVTKEQPSKLSVEKKSGISNLPILVKNLQELHRWQNHVLEEIARQVKNI